MVFSRDGGAPRRAAFGVQGLAIVALICVAALAGGRPQTLSAGQGVLSTWVELGPEGRVIARAVTAGATCPTILIDGRAESMQVRAAPTLPDFPVTTCETAIATGARAASIDGQALPLPHPNPQRIVVTGDTGCRIKAGTGSSAGHYQDCNDPDAWPFAKIAQTAAAWQPDLVIHVGDYMYRESPCPAEKAGCAGPTGYTWATWDADFFTPAAPLLRAAPWIVVRGNHEDCARSGAIWFRFLDPRPFTGRCDDYTEPYAVSLGDLQLLLLDSSAADDYEVQPVQVAEYRRQFTALHGMASGNAWLLTHDPLWVFGHLGVENGVEQLFRDNENLQEASAGLLPPGLQLVVAGHIHLFEALSFREPLPPQLVVGNGGTALDPPITTPLAGLEIGGATVAAGVMRDAFGYVTMQPSSGGWSANLRTIDDRVLVGCTFQRFAMSCRP